MWRCFPNKIEKEVLERVTPETVILFVGRRPDEKPRAQTLKLLEEVMVLRTDERGTITYFFGRGEGRDRGAKVGSNMCRMIKPTLC
jgi:beta-lactamase superfamily II metal-dependent hydrolase